MVKNYKKMTDFCQNTKISHFKFTKLKTENIFQTRKYSESRFTWIARP